MKNAEFNSLLKDQDFTGATELLKRSLQQAEIINPRQDETWAPPADHLGYAILEAQGVEAYQKYWENILRFFQEVLEKSWGHTHKGHIYFRSGFAYLGSDLAKAKDIIQKSVSEDTAFEQSYQNQLRIRIPLEEVMVRYPSFVFIRFLEIIQDAVSLSDQERKAFFRGLVPTHWDVIWGPKPVDERLVRSAIREIVSKKMLEKAYDIFNSIQIEFALRNGIGLVGSSKLLLDTLLYDRLHYQMGIDSIAGKDIQGAELGDLLSEIWKHQTISNEPIWSVFQCANQLAVNFPRFEKKKEQSTGLTTAMAVGIKILIDMALVEWMNTLRN